MTTGSNPAAATDHDLVLTRVFDAPRELVFRAWTEPEQMAQWFAPRMFTVPVCELDARPGGAILLHMQGPDGSVFPMKGVFNEVVPPERIVMTAGALFDEDDNPALEDRTTITFEEHEGKTTITLRVDLIKAAAEAAGALEGMEQGWNESLDKLGEHLARIAA